MNKSGLNNDHKKILEDSAAMIFDEIAQNLCLAKLTLSLYKTDNQVSLKDKIKKSHDLVSKSIKLLRKVGESINEMKNNIQTK